MDSKIQQALARQFEKHRIVFWYDRGRELRTEYEALALEGVEKIELKNNEFAVKYRILREQPAQKYLLYQEGPPPADLDNWLLDVLLAHGEFRADQVSLWLGQLELDPTFGEVLRTHLEFCRSGKRMDTLKTLLTSDDSPATLPLKMVAVCVGVEPKLDSILEGLLGKLADEKDDTEMLIARCNLSDVLWKRVRLDYAYESASAGVKDFAIWLFRTCYKLGFEDDPARAAAQVLFRRWKDMRQHEGAFRALSERFAALFKIKDDLANRDYRSLARMDMYRLIDQRILVGLAHDVASRTVSAADCSALIKERRPGFWFAEFADVYEAVDCAAQFLAEMATLDLTMETLREGIERYSERWFRIDQLYRKFIYHARVSNLPTLLANLSEQVENQYSNTYLLALNDRWQALVEQSATWSVPGILRQRDFFTDRVQPYHERKHKIFVIISDALRYEIAEELLRLIRMEDRFEGEIEPAVGILPSYTQLGMAALLPHQLLAIHPDKGSAVVYADGQDTRGEANRAKIVRAAVRGTAIQAEEFMQMTRDKSREFVRENDMVYIYHNAIDAVGDDRDREEGVFEEAEKALRELVNLIKKLHNANGYNFLITADHGFIYQHRELAESDFLSVTPSGANIITSTRRYVLGQGLTPQPSFKTFSAAQLGLDGDFEVQFPKSINRLRKQGAGSRYVHGGLTLQEIVVPVVRINKKRTTDVSRVDVVVMHTGSQKITTGQLTVRLFQREPVSEKVHPRTLRIGLYAKDGALLSDTHDLIFDLTSEYDREREKSVRLLLSKDASRYDGQTVIVRVSEREAGTTYEADVESVEYVLQRSFTSDFDI